MRLKKGHYNASAQHSTAQHSTAQHSTAQHSTAQQNSLDNLSPKAQQLSQLKSILPEIFSENEIDFEKFKQLFANEISTNSDRYHLNWAGKSKAYQTLQTLTTKTLKDENKIYFVTETKNTGNNIQSGVEEDKLRESEQMKIAYARQNFNSLRKDCPDLDYQVLKTVAELSKH